MKALLALIVVGAVVYFFMNFGAGRVGGPLSPPFGVSFRNSYIGAGVVMNVSNHSDKNLYGVRVHIAGKNGRSTDANIATVLKPGEEKEVGWLELDRWKLEVGEDISVYADSYPAPFMTSCLGDRK